MVFTFVSGHFLAAPARFASKVFTKAPLRTLRDVFYFVSKLLRCAATSGATLKKSASLKNFKACVQEKFL
jgi:hypothetical protein